jgi:hypothetical protein
MLKDLIVPKKSKEYLLQKPLPYRIGWIHCYRGLPLEDNIDSSNSVVNEYKDGYNDCLNYQHKCA